MSPMSSGFSGFELHSATAKLKLPAGLHLRHGGRGRQQDDRECDRCPEAGGGNQPGQRRGEGDGRGDSHVAIDLATGGAFAFPPRVRSDLVAG